MEYLRLCLVIISLFFGLVSAQTGESNLNASYVELISGLALGEMPTFSGVCQLQGDWCTTKCQTAGGRDGRCNKVGLCICNPL
ncbi:hypothetical protein KR026_011819 [Drosophila bipectinata]|nr:hypothetical protein KR026_011819 [Drosophila bipectinata]